MIEFFGLSVFMMVRWSESIGKLVDDEVVFILPVFFVVSWSYVGKLVDDRILWTLSVLLVANKLVDEENSLIISVLLVIKW